MTPETLLVVSVLFTQVGADAPANPRRPAPALFFKERATEEEETTKPQARFVADWNNGYNNATSTRRPRSAFPVGDAPVEAGPVAEGPVGVAPEEAAIQPETLGDREDPAWRGALNNAPPPTNPPARRPPTNYGPPSYAAQDHTQLTHTGRPQQQIVPTTVAGHMVARWFEPAPEEHSAGNQLTLLDSLEGTSDPTSRARVVAAYWQAAGAAAEERCARDEVGWLGSFNEASGGANLLTAKRAADAELLSAEVKRDEAAEALARLVHRSGLEQYPLTVELPCVEAYRTHAENLLAGRSEGDEMKRLARKLPPLLSVVSARSKAVEAAEALQRQLADGRTAATAADVLTAYSELRYQRREFFASVVTYNQVIARYAFGAADRGLEPSRAVAMLVARPRNIARVPSNSRASYEPAQIATPVAGEMEDPTYLR